MTVSPPAPSSASGARDHWVAVLHPRAGEREPMYAQLEHLLAITADDRDRDRAAYRNVCFLTQALNADADFQPYRREARFRGLKRALDARLAGRAGSCVYRFSDAVN